MRRPVTVVTLGSRGSIATTRSWIEVQPSGTTLDARRSSADMVASPDPT